MHLSQSQISLQARAGAVFDRSPATGGADGQTAAGVDHGMAGKAGGEGGKESGQNRCAGDAGRSRGAEASGGSGGKSGGFTGGPGGGRAGGTGHLVERLGPRVLP